jgi:hypothetical protein
VLDDESTRGSSGSRSAGVRGNRGADPRSLEHSQTERTPRVARRRGCVTGSSIGLRPPCVRTARQMRWRPDSGTRDLPGIAVSSSRLFGDRVFLNAREGIALAA